MILIIFCFVSATRCYAEFGQSKKETNKSYWLTFGMDAAPLLLFGGASIFCSFQSGLDEDEWGSEFNSERFDCFRLLHKISLLPLSLGTVPSHYYVETHPFSTVAYTLSKIALNGIFILISLFPNTFDSFMYIGFIPGVTLATTVYIVEMIDQGIHVHWYNEKLNKSAKKDGISISPYAWSDRFGLAMQVKF